MKRNTTFNETVTEMKMDSQIRVRMTSVGQEGWADQPIGLDFLEALLGIVERCFSAVSAWNQTATPAGVLTEKLLKRLDKCRTKG